jgi:hypothetical protein
VRHCSLFLLVFITSCTTEEPGTETGPSSSEESGDEGPMQAGCAMGQPDQIYRPDMVGCSGFETQCTAHELCAPGWHLCSRIDFEMMGGLEVAATEPRWLEGCVREPGPDNPTCATLSICTGDCSTSVTDPEEFDLTFTCNNAVELRSDLAPYGLVASDVQRKVGCMGVMCIYADAMPTPTALGATCCMD